MLISLVFTLRSTARVPILGPLGYPIKSWFLHEIDRLDAEIANELHNGAGPKPYTVSTLLDASGRPLPADTWLEAGQATWFRISLLWPLLVDLALSRWLPDLPESLKLYKMNFRLQAWTVDPSRHPWAGQTSFAALLDGAGAGRPDRRATLEFFSPTAFRSDGIDIPLPLPNHIFRSLWERWNAFCPQELELHAAWPGFAAACITISELVDLNTQRWVFSNGSRGSATGFTGQATFNLLPQHQCGDYAAEWEGAAGVLQALSRFAFYSGVGHHTTFGLGQARPAGTRR